MPTYFGNTVFSIPGRHPEWQGELLTPFNYPSNVPIAPSGSIITELPTSAIVSTPYYAALFQIGLSPSLNWSVSAGSLPPGLTLSYNILSGTPTQSGVYSFTITALGQFGISAARSYRLMVAPAVLTIGVQVGGGFAAVNTNATSDAIQLMSLAVGQDIDAGANFLYANLDAFFVAMFNAEIANINSLYPNLAIAAAAAALKMAKQGV
jgi:hypothetical protein